MKIGKLPEQVLVRSVIKKISHRRDEVLFGPGVGRDCAALKLAKDEIFVISSDPITGTVKDIGSHCIYITANGSCRRRASGGDGDGAIAA